MKNVWINYNKDSDSFSLVTDFPINNVVLNSPLSIGWLITGKCNLKCIHCYGNEEELPSELSTEDNMMIASKIVAEWIQRVSISGWEPCMRKDIFDIIEYLSSNGISVILSTNWIFVKEYIHKLKGLRHIEISIDGSNADIHGKLRPVRYGDDRLSFNKAIEWLKATSSAWILTRALTTLNIYNKEDLFWIWKILSDIGVQEWHIWRVVNAGRARFIYGELNGFPFDQTIIETLQIEFPNIRIQFNYPSKASNYYALILPNGNITTQDTVTWEKIELWSLLEYSIGDFRNDKNYDLDWHIKKWLNIN